jgi:hypothetical protein
MEFRKAVKQAAKLRLSLIAPAGYGKTYSALAIATALSPGKVAVIDTEHGSSEKYADLFDFSVLHLHDFDPENYVAAIAAAQRSGFETIIIDSLSHGWAGKGGALEQVDKEAAKSKSGSTFHAWRSVTPKHNTLVEAMLQSSAHIIATMRSKMEHHYDPETKRVRKLGLAAVQREGMEYEFDLVGEIDENHNMVVTKSRMPQLSGRVVSKPGKELAGELLGWLAGKPAIVAPPPCTDEQITTIRKLMDGWIKASGLDPNDRETIAAKWSEMVREMFAVSSAKQLNQRQASSLIEYLESVQLAAEHATNPTVQAMEEMEAASAQGKEDANQEASTPIPA